MRVEAHSGYLGYLCLWGFSAGEVVHLGLFEPGGKRVATKDMVAGPDYGYTSDVVQIELWFAGLQTGEWRAEATSSQVSLEYRFTVSEPDSPMVVVMPGSAVDIFGGERWLFCSKNAYRPDDKLVVFGAGLPPRQQFPCGIYYHDEHDDLANDPVTLVFERLVTTDDQGHFWLVLPGDESWPTGLYFAVALPQVEYNQSRGKYTASRLGCFVIATK
jgi:hypothetical protein